MHCLSFRGICLTAASDLFPFLFVIIWDISFQLLKLLLWLRTTDEGSVPEMRIWSILLIKSDLKWCIHLSRSLFLYFSTRIDRVIIFSLFNVIVTRPLNWYSNSGLLGVPDSRGVTIHRSIDTVRYFCSVRCSIQNSKFRFGSKKKERDQCYF